jgi:hypothetical protein
MPKKSSRMTSIIDSVFRTPFVTNAEEKVQVREGLVSLLKL